MDLLRRRQDKRSDAQEVADEVERRLLRQTIELAQRRLQEIERGHTEEARRRADESDFARYKAEIDMRRPPEAGADPPAGDTDG